MFSLFETSNFWTGRLSSTLPKSRWAMRLDARARRFLRCIPSQVCFEPLTMIHRSPRAGSRRRPENSGDIRVRGKTCHLCDDGDDGPGYDLWHVCLNAQRRVPTPTLLRSAILVSPFYLGASCQCAVFLALNAESRAFSVSGTSLSLACRPSCPSCRMTSIRCQSLWERCLTALFWKETRYVWWRILGVDTR
jgi:hypothetical protein